MPRACRTSRRCSTGSRPSRSRPPTPHGTEAFLIRPDGYLGTRVTLDESAGPNEDAALFEHLDRIFAAV